MGSVRDPCDQVRWNKYEYNLTYKMCSELETNEYEFSTSTLDKINGFSSKNPIYRNVWLMYLWLGFLEY